MGIKINTEEFIKRATKKHKGKYDYSHVVYVKASEKVDIICPKHGVFRQVATYHIGGGTCPNCWHERLLAHNWTPGRKSIKGSTHKRCPKCKKTYPRTIDFFGNNSRISDGLHIYCYKCVGIMQKEWNKYNANKQRKYQNKSNKKRKESGKTKQYYQNKRNTDDTFNIANNLRNLLWRALKTQNANKYHSLKEDVGCSLIELKEWITCNFDDGMTWNNKGRFGWHIDHVIPLSAFDLKNPLHQKICSHYTNLHPMWGIPNIQKGCKYNPKDLISYIAKFDEKGVLKSMS